MFGIGRSTKDPLAERRSAERWLATFSPSDPLAAHAALLTELGVAAERDAPRTPARLEALFHLDTLTEPMRRGLTTQYLDHGNRSTRVESQLWQAMFDLTQAFLNCYNGYAREYSGRAPTGRWQSLLPELIARQVVHEGIDAKIRLYRYEQWIPARWGELHGMFQTACTAQIERVPVGALADGTLTTIEQEYLRVLLLLLMNAGNLSPKHVQWVAEHLTEWCAPLRLTLEAPGVSSFYVDVGDRAGLRRRSNESPLEGRILFLDTRPLHAMLMQNVVMLEQKVRSEPLSDKMSRRADQLTLVTKLAAQVDPEFRPVARRGERQSASGNVDAIVGFARISGFLRDEETAPIVEQRRTGSYGDTMEIATFGHLRNEAARQQEMARRRLATFAAQGGPWEVRDVSQTGFRLVAPMSAASALTLGTLAAIRPQGESLWTLGIVRRMKRLTAERAETGLQIIANTLVGVELSSVRRGEADYSVDGEVPTVSGRRFHGLFLSLRKRGTDSSIQTLIVPAGEYQPGKRLNMSVGSSTHPIAFGRLLEQQTDWVWATVETFDPALSKANGNSERTRS
jgi:hypothetical protein